MELLVILLFAGALTSGSSQPISSKGLVILSPGPIAPPRSDLLSRSPYSDHEYNALGGDKSSWSPYNQDEVLGDSGSIEMQQKKMPTFGENRSTWGRPQHARNIEVERIDSTDHLPRPGYEKSSWSPYSVERELEVLGGEGRSWSPYRQVDVAGELGSMELQQKNVPNFGDDKSTWGRPQRAANVVRFDSIHNFPRPGFDKNSWSPYPMQREQEILGGDVRSLSPDHQVDVTGPSGSTEMQQKDLPSFGEDRSTWGRPQRAGNVKLIRIGSADDIPRPGFDKMSWSPYPIRRELNVQGENGNGWLHSAFPQIGLPTDVVMHAFGNDLWIPYNVQDNSGSDEQPVIELTHFVKNFQPETSEESSLEPDLELGFAVQPQLLHAPRRENNSRHILETEITRDVRVEHESHITREYLPEESESRSEEGSAEIGDPILTFLIAP